MLPADTFPQTAAPTVLACTVRAVWMHPFGWPVVPEVIGQHDDIVGTETDGFGPSLPLQGLVPQGDSGMIDPLPSRRHAVRQGQVRFPVGVIAVGGDDGALEGGLFHQRSDSIVQLLADDGRFRLAVRHKKGQLPGQEHRVKGYDNCVGPEDRIIGDDELRRVLHEKHHPIPAGDAYILLQKAGQGVHFFQQLPVRNLPAVIVDRHFVRIPGCGHLQVVIRIGLGNGQGLGHPVGPMIEMTGQHIDPPAFSEVY